MRENVKLARDYCRETCPEVDNIAQEFLEKIKDAGTHKLRYALEQACSDLIDVQAALEAAETEIADLKRQLSDALEELELARAAA